MVLKRTLAGDAAEHRSGESGRLLKQSRTTKAQTTVSSGETGVDTSGKENRSTYWLSGCDRGEGGAGDGCQGPDGLVSGW